MQIGGSRATALTSDRHAARLVFQRESELPNLPFRSEACPRIVGEHRFMIMEGATPTFMPDCDVVVISADWCGERLDWCELFGLQDLCWRPPRG